ncbi:MAG: ectoine/hydroxyectoine ABC transporter substrate-binding protein EhuB [Alicyclobacillus macrosporangiidus]|nr:ectoine/hydroxyectoine ABC transporter substrate-binding protein EhuB [Alicyclobacillus macrosporangiidus]
MLAVAVVGCGSSPAAGAAPGNANADHASTGAGTADSLYDKVKKQGYITVGFANENPFGYATADGKLTGESPEVARAVLKEMGLGNVQLQGVLTQFGSLIPGLKAHRFDMVAAGMYITPERAKEVAFANPDYKIGEALAVKKGNPLDLHSYEDIAKNPKAKIAIMAGAIENQYVQKLGVKPSQIVTVPDTPSALAAVDSGRADATTMTSLTLSTMLKEKPDPKIEVVSDFKQPVIDGKSVYGYGAVAFRKEDQAFVEKFNEALAKLEDSGELMKILEPFGFTKDNLPNHVTAEQVINGQAG